MVEHSIGNGEVHSSTLCGSTIFLPGNRCFSFLHCTSRDLIGARFPQDLVAFNQLHKLNLPVYGASVLGARMSDEKIGIGGWPRQGQVRPFIENSALSIGRIYREGTGLSLFRRWLGAAEAVTATYPARLATLLVVLAILYWRTPPRGPGPVESPQNRACRDNSCSFIDRRCPTRLRRLKPCGKDRPA